MVRELAAVLDRKERRPKLAREPPRYVKMIKPTIDDPVSDSHAFWLVRGDHLTRD